MENQPFLLTELEDLSSIFAPLKAATRIKYTCFDVSNNFLIFGATSGGLYVFRREPCCFLQLLPNKEGSVTQLSISPDEKLIAFSTVKGIICVVERSSHSAKPLITTAEHQNEHITSLQWNEENNELFIGDSSGKVSVVTVPIFPTKNMFQTPAFVLMKLDSKIVQMDFSSNMLLVSTLTKCYICDTTKEIFRQVGHKLRDGEYGACILNTQHDHDIMLHSSKISSDKASTEHVNASDLKIFCARPGSRVWEVAIDGTVLRTHHFKEALAVPPRKIYFVNNSSSHSNNSSSILTNGLYLNSEQVNSNFSEQSFNFQKLYVILSRFLFTYKSDGIYVFDPRTSNVVLWNNEIPNIVDVKCLNDVIYVWSNFGKMFALNVAPLDKFIVRLYFQKKYLDLAKTCLEFENFLIGQVTDCSKLYVLHDLDEKLKSDENFKELCDRLSPLIAICKESAQKRKIQNAQKLQSGIYLVSKNDQMILDDGRVTNQKLLRPNYLNLKGRSHSVSPERLQNGDVDHRGSTSSLPDLIKEGKTEEILNSPPEVVVNGRREKEGKMSQPEFDTKNVLEICEVINKSSEPSTDLVFSLFDNILALSVNNKPQDGNSLEVVQSFPLNSYFSEDNINLISDLFHASLKSQQMFEWLLKFKGDWLTQAVRNYPSLLLQNHSVEELELDIKLSKVLKLFSNVLREEILDMIRKSEMKCYYWSLLEILDVYHDCSMSSVSHSTLDLANVTSTPKILNIAYFLMNVGQIEQCSRYWHKLDLQDMVYLMLKFEESSKETGKTSEIIELQCHTLFLSYLDKTCEGRRLISGCNDLVENYIITCLENINCAASCVKESNCSCGFPCTGLQPSMTMFPDIGHALVEKTWPKNPGRCLEICGRVPYLWKYLIYIRRNKPLNDLLPLIIQSGEIQELENRSHEVDVKVLEKSIKFLIEMKKGNCLNCKRKIENVEIGTVSWTEFGILCIKLLGPKETLELFTKYANDISCKELEQLFFKSIIFSSVMEKHKKGLTKSVVNLLRGNQIQESNQVSVLSANLKNEIFKEGDLKKFNLPGSDTNSHHWGIKMNFKNICGVCSLPLDTKVLISEAGLLVFKCSHAFHSACLNKINLECPVCRDKSANDTE